MFVLTNLSKSGYLQIKSDRELLSKKIQQNQSLLDEIDLALPFLKSIYEPKISIQFRDQIQQYIASTKIIFNGENINIEEKLGSKTDFNGKDDSALIEKAEVQINNRIKNQFPLHFQD